MENLKLRRKRISFNTRAAGQMLERAAALMHEAKLLHDRLEGHYKQAMDFEKADQLTERYLKMILQGAEHAEG